MGAASVLVIMGVGQSEGACPFSKPLDLSLPAPPRAAPHGCCARPSLQRTGRGVV